MTSLPQYTWDQAEIVRAWPPRAFAGLGINPATIRQWASRGHITPVGTGPNGSRLYNYDQVVQHANRTSPAVIGEPRNTCHTVNADGSPMPTADAPARETS